MSFLVNDNEYSPFGLAWLRGVTPARFGVFAAVSLLVAFYGFGGWIIRNGYASIPWNLANRFARCFLCAMPMFLLVIRTEAWTARSPAPARIGALALAVLAVALMFTVLRYGMPGTNTMSFARVWQELVGHFVRSLVTGGLLTAILYFAIRERDAARLLHRAQLSRVETEGQLAESRLNLLRAQIEPHFLFNS